MDRTIIAPWKAEEKELSERLYKKLRGLTLLFTPSEELSKCLSEDMFLKPNQHAFFHVMHFLYGALDVAEFKKRFYWPIVDKRSESNFRTATVEYLKNLSDKHNLHWNIKSYLVLMPGGIKFITFLLDFIALIVKELTVQKERQLGADIETGRNIDWNIKRFERKNKMLKQLASKYMSDMDELIGEYHKNIASMKNELEEMAIATKVPVKTLLDENFQQQFHADNERLLDTKIRKPTEELKSLAEPLEALGNLVDKCQTKDSTTSHKVNKKSLKEALDAIKKQYEEQNTLTSGEEGSMKALINVFNCLHADVLASLKEADANESDYDFLNSELVTLRSECEELERNMKGFQLALNASSQKKAEKPESEDLAMSPFRDIPSEDCMTEGEKKSNLNLLLAKYVSTPPIKSDAMDSGRSVNYRLPLLDQQNAQIKEEIDSFLVPSLSTRKKVVKHSQADQSLRDLNSTMNKSKIVDPMQLLRTLQKSNSKIKPPPLTSQQRNESSLSKLGSKWKERENLLTSANSTVVGEDATLKQELGFTSPTGNSKSLGSKGLNTSTCPGAPMLNYSKKLSAVKKVQSDSFNFHNLSTSPSGRLESLVHIDNSVKELIKIQLNDATLNDTEIFSATKMCRQEAVDNPVDDDKQSNCENNPNLINVESKSCFANKSFESEEEQLFNISDGVLRDISM